MQRRTNRFQKRERPVARNCEFCLHKTIPDYKESAILRRYMTERGKILAASRNGLCSKHQRALSRAVKRARHVALLPFVVRA